MHKRLNLLHSSSPAHHVHLSSCRSAPPSSFSGRGLRREGSRDRSHLTLTRSTHPHRPTEHCLYYFCHFYTHFVSTHHFLFRSVFSVYCPAAFNELQELFILFTPLNLLIVCGVPSILIDTFDCLFCNCLCNCVCNCLHV